MRLDFRLLIIDDDPQYVEEAIKSLREHLATNGFDLAETVPDTCTREALAELAHRQGREFDLVMVDYHLNPNDTGADILETLRHRMKYTDMVFYSGDPNVNLYGEMADREIQGVFLADRNELTDVLVDIADTVLGKAIDINHTRGVAMAEVADMDMLMEKALRTVLTSGARECLSAKEEEIVRKLLERREESLSDLRARLRHGGLLEIVEDGRVFTSNDKWMALRKLTECLSQKPEEPLAILKQYQTDVLEKRNRLAHDWEQGEKDGNPVLRSRGNRSERDVVNEEWMKELRNALRKHKTALSEICRAIEEEFGATDNVEKTEP